MLAKMKNKQKNFISTNNLSEATATNATTTEENSNQLTCAACQESLTDFSERSFVQLGYSHRSKLLFHSHNQIRLTREQAHNA